MGAVGGGQRARRSVHPDAEGVAGAMIRPRLRTLRARLLWGAVLVITPTMTGVFLLVERHQRAAIVEEMERRGDVMARSLAAVSQGPLLLYNFTALEQNVARAAGEPDVVYAIVLDAEGKVAAHSRSPDRVGHVLKSKVDLEAAFNHMVAELAQQRVALEDANTELRRGFEQLADLKTYTDNILASLTTGIVTVDLDGRVVTLNPAAELMTGFFAGEVRGRYCTEVFAHTPDLAELLMETLASRVPVPGVTVTLRRRNGRAMPVELSAAPLRGGEGKELGVIGVFRDLTRVRQLEDRLRRSDRLAAIGEVAAGLAHAIKNPLTSLLTFSRHLSRRFEDPEFRQKFLSVVPRELERINSIVEGLLELARPARLTFKPLRLPALLERVLELYGDRLEAQSIRVVRDWRRDVPVVWVDQEALYRALVNLVANALDAMPRGGRLTRRVARSDGATLPSARAGTRRVAVEVEDSGTGIEPADLDRIFNPFFSTKES